MAQFRVPRIKTSQRISVVFDTAEIVYDEDNAVYYGGDGVTIGGVALGQGAPPRVETITLSAQDIQQKSVKLQFPPFDPTKVILTPVGGPVQLNGIDFICVNDTLHFDGLGLDNVLEENDVIVVSY